ncbi:hypothetical protein [Hymenobacter chitinivorans]|uniref:Uncharacterized protein n=1 Tax=Hymenobacter chitinivorans DSM 11115 TaxID=1121954 RepID=A0A2M9BN35_9BACT|nr:hypothetical protein [Hymenobacter chitinivorans]PJJ59363.1 hypothetical protein CLV45_0780 [Hymenobacter chitinivorans DSM 11115]
MTLAFPLLPTSQDYTVTVQTTNLLGNLLYENTRQTTFRKQPLQKTAAGWLYEVTVLSFQQTENQGLAQLDADTAQLRRRLLIETDAAGALERIANKEELRAQWAKLEPELLRKYRRSDQITPGMVSGLGQVLHGDGYLEDVLRRGYEYGTLFPAFYGQTYGEHPVPGPPRTIARFLGNLDLPLTTQIKRRTETLTDVELALVVEGQVDQETYPAEAVRQGLRTMTDQYDLDTTLNSQHVESYEFDHRSSLLNAAQFTVFGVQGVFMSKTLCTLQPAGA